MMKGKLIFIEGVSGIGKTTMASLLCNKLRHLGNTCVCHLEGDSDNPLDPFQGTYPPAIPLPVFTDTYANCWRRFMESQLEQELSHVFDGTLLHHQVNDLIRNYGASDEAIVTHLTDLLKIVKPTNPVVFYLTSRDVAQRLRSARGSRGQSIATMSQIAFWDNRKRVDLLALDRLSVISHILNVDNGWDKALETMMEYIA